eukprot:1181344-Prorocentrum_minimum.AAC.3
MPQHPPPPGSGSPPIDSARARDAHPGWHPHTAGRRCGSCAPRGPAEMEDSPRGIRTHQRECKFTKGNQNSPKGKRFRRRICEFTEGNTISPKDMRIHRRELADPPAGVGDQRLDRIVYHFYLFGTSND